VRNHKYDAIKESLLQLASILQLQEPEGQQEEEQLADILLQQHVDQQQQQQQQQLASSLQQLAEDQQQGQCLSTSQLPPQVELAGRSPWHVTPLLQTAQSRLSKGH